MKLIRNIAIIVTLFILFSVTAFTQSSISGTITAEEYGSIEPLPYVNVAIAGSTNGTVTDFDGKFKLNVPEGTHNVSISFVGYEKETITVITKSSVPVVINKQLKNSDDILMAVQVVAEINKHSKASEIAEVKNATGIDNVISSESMNEKNVSTASDATKKMVGLSVVGSKYVFVRGMGDRYNSAYLNGIPLPSPDPDNKVIPLDIFPSSVIQSISVKKAFTPELYGDFAGGAIDIRTKQYPSKPTFNVKLGTSINTQSTFKDFKSYNGGKNDFWGFEDGSRSMPVDAIQSDYYTATSTNTDGNINGFEHNFNTSTNSSPINRSIGIFAGNKFILGKEKDNSDKVLGISFVANYSNKHNYQNGDYRIINAQDETQVDYSFEKWSFNTKGSALGNVFLQLNENHNIQLNSLFINISSDEVRETTGFNWDYVDNVFSRRLTYKQNNLLANQVSGNHVFFNNKLEMNWGLGFNATKSIEPDRRQLIYCYADGANQDEYTMNDMDVNDNHRFFSELNENEVSAKGQIKYNITTEEIDGVETPKTSVIAGYNTKTKSRTFDYRQFNYNVKNLDNIHSSVDVNSPESYINDESMDQGGFYIREMGDPASKYDVYQNITAFYGAFDWKPSDKLQFLTGLRYEDGDQYLITKNQQIPTITERYEVKAGNISDKILPSVVMKYSANDTNIVRFTVSKTVSRPGFKEVAPFEYVEMFAGTKSKGNPLLKNAFVYNADLRLERYPRFGERIAIGGFYKYISNPIEKTMLATASGQLQSFANAQKGVVTGLELEFTKQLTFIGRDSSRINNLFSNISFNANAAYIYSQVSIDTIVEGASIISTNLNRPLQGASPYLANIDLTYKKRFSENFKGTVAVSYNIFGRRLYAAGAQGIGDSYENSAGNLNLVFRGEFNKRFIAGITVGNLTNPTYAIIQEGKDRDLTINSYQRGVTIGCSLTYKLFEKNSNKQEVID